MNIYLFDFDNTIVNLPYEETIEFLDQEESLDPKLNFTAIVKIIVDKIKKAQDGKVANKAKVNLFKSKRAANRKSKKGFIGQVRINGYGAIIMNDKGNKMVGITFPVLKKNPSDGKYTAQDRLTYKFFLNKLRLGQDRVHSSKQFRDYLKTMEKYHKNLNQEFAKIPQGDFGDE